MSMSLLLLAHHSFSSWTILQEGRADSHTVLTAEQWDGHILRNQTKDSGMYFF